MRNTNEYDFMAEELERRRPQSVAGQRYGSTYRDLKSHNSSFSFRHGEGADVEKLSLTLNKKVGIYIEKLRD